MAAISTIVAVASLAVAAASAVAQHSAQKEAKQAAGKAAEEQRKARSEQAAELSAKAAAERRTQLREERIKRAKIIQASENTGVSESSGELGAVGNLNTQVGSNIGQNIGSLERAGNITALNQNAADFMSSSQNSIFDANQWGGVGSFGQSVFGAAGGFNAFKPETQAPAPVENRSIPYKG